MKDFYDPKEKLTMFDFSFNSIMDDLENSHCDGTAILCFSSNRERTHICQR